MSGAFNPMFWLGTVMVQVAWKLPSWVVAVMVAVPGLILVIRPDGETVATEVLLLVYVMFWFVALDGEIVGVNCWVEPTTSVAFVGVSVSPVTVIDGVPIFKLLTWTGVSEFVVELFPSSPLVL